MQSRLVPLTFVMLLALLLPWCCSTTRAAEPTREEVLAKLLPFAPEPNESPNAESSNAPRVDVQSLERKILCGYQGWFTTPQDGLNRGWTHYARQGRFEPGYCTIDLWPDLTEFDDDEKFATPFRHADGAVAHVFSSANAKTVRRHFRWMREYGIDGVFVQRFAVETRAPRNLNHVNTVLTHCRAAANLEGRAYAVMYDLSGLGKGEMKHVIDDWKQLVDRFHVGRDPHDRAYLRHRGKPLVAVWGIGFNDRRRYSLDECRELVRFLKDDPQYGGMTVMVGVPTGWRTLDRDALSAPLLHEIIRDADVVSPWTVGRYNSLEAVERHATRVMKPDLEWCRDAGKDYLPVMFPGFSWHNLRSQSPLDQIPRHQGRFVWAQYRHAQAAGATMFYQAMFDEMDEGTAIFKCTNAPPTGASSFLTMEGLPSDHYLWLAGQAGRLLREEIPPSEQLPPRKP